MTEYAQLSLNTMLPCQPGESPMYRLPAMMAGQFHLTANGHSLPSVGAHLALTGEHSDLAGNTGLTNIGVGVGVGVGNPGLPSGPGNPFPPPYPVVLDLFHGDTLVANGSSILQTSNGADASWRVRVNFPSTALASDHVRIDLSPYTSTLPVLTRKIPLAFLKQGFDNNWNGRQYISLAFEDSTLFIRFDPEIASYYHLPDVQYPVATHLTETPPNMMVTSAVLSVDSSSGGYEDIPGKPAYIRLTVGVGGIGGQPITGSIAGVDYEIDAFTVTATFYLTTSTAAVGSRLQNVVGYRTHIDTDLMEKVSKTNSWINVWADVANAIAESEASSYLYHTALPQARQWFDARSGMVGAALTPWLLGAAYDVIDVTYSPTNSQPVPADGPQGDIVITYIGVERPALRRAIAPRPPSALTITADAPGGFTGVAYNAPLQAEGGTAPYTWSATGELPPGVTLADGTLSGTPSAQGLFAFTLNVVDAAGDHAARPCVIAINADGFAIATPSPLPQAASGSAYAVVFAAHGASGNLHWSATGAPAGLTMSGAGVLSGTPTGDGAVAAIEVTATGPGGAVARGAYTLDVLDPLLFGEQRYTPRGAGTTRYEAPRTSTRHNRPPEGPVVDPGNLSKIEHIVVLMMENRSFDHMLGYLSREGGRGDIEGLKWENDSNRTQLNYYNGNFYYPTRLTNTHLFNPESLGPDHSYESVMAQMDDDMGHFVSDYARNKISDDDPAQLGQVMGYYTGEQLPTYDFLAREFCVCDHWFCSHPGPTWPNRFVSLTGDLNRDSYGEPEVNTPLYSDFTPSEATTLFDLLSARNVTWKYFEQRASTMRAYTKYTFDMVHVLEYSDPDVGFAKTCLDGLPSVTFVDPLFGDLPAGVNSPQDNDDAPPSDLADGQRFVHEVVSTLFTPSTNPNWLTTMLVICYDEHGGFYDHVQPPESPVPLIGQTSGKLGPRVPAFVVSPWTPAGTVLKETFEHGTIAATILNTFCGPRPPILSPRVSAARDLRDALTLETPRGMTTPLLGGLTVPLPSAPVRAEARMFVAPSRPDSFGSLLGALALMLGRGGSETPSERA